MVLSPATTDFRRRTSGNGAGNDIEVPSLSNNSHSIGRCNILFQGGRTIRVLPSCKSSKPRQLMDQKDIINSAIASPLGLPSDCLIGLQAAQ